ncbi:MAG: hypothetical protein EPN48_16030 [Microbacteriaceae bacterium]|nr:MAG: hypothetical protein EPN48_16030 [Microbacteriaceae bacterium]
MSGLAGVVESEGVDEVDGLLEPVDPVDEVEPVDVEPVEPVEPVKVDPVEPVDEVEPVEAGAEVDDEPPAGCPDVHVTELPSVDRTQFICEPELPTAGVDDGVEVDDGVGAGDIDVGAGAVTT